jgi:TolA-binding protein
VTRQFVPAKVHIKEQKPVFERFGAHWTPTQLILDEDGAEQHRIEGFLPAEDFLAQLELGLAKRHFKHQEFGEAATLFRSLCERSQGAGAAAEACYWAGVAAYKADSDASHLKETAAVLRRRYPDSEWARKASVWG